MLGMASLASTQAAEPSTNAVPPPWPPVSQSSQEGVGGRKVELFAHGQKPSWGYGAKYIPADRSGFYLVHPKEPTKNARW